MGDKIEEKIDRIEKAVVENTQSVSNLSKTVDKLAAVVTQNSSDINDLIKIVVSIKDNLESFQEETVKNFEMTNGKIEGVQRGLDSNFERHNALEARVSKIEIELHPQGV